jgi:hypothetical protein
MIAGDIEGISLDEEFFCQICYERKRISSKIDSYTAQDVRRSLPLDCTKKDIYSFLMKEADMLQYKKHNKENTPPTVGNEQKSSPDTNDDVDSLEAVDVVVLPCKHTFCLDCLRRYIETQVSSGSFRVEQGTKCFYIPSMDPMNDSDENDDYQETTNMKDPILKEKENEEEGNVSMLMSSPSSSKREVAMWTPYNRDRDQPCNRIIDKDIIISLLKQWNEVSECDPFYSRVLSEENTHRVHTHTYAYKGEELLARIDRFEWLAQHSTRGRECPYCNYAQICVPVRSDDDGGDGDDDDDDNNKAGDDEVEALVCTVIDNNEDVSDDRDDNSVLCRNQDCRQSFCLVHANAHPNIPCREYEKKNAAENVESLTLIDTMSKKCPGCGVLGRFPLYALL